MNMSKCFFSNLQKIAKILENLIINLKITISFNKESQIPKNRASWLVEMMMTSELHITQVILEMLKSIIKRTKVHWNYKNNKMFLQMEEKDKKMIIKKSFQSIMTMRVILVNNMNRLMINLILMNSMMRPMKKYRELLN